ncbi:MAG: hypothetical protein V4819_01200 [Verrucomicrobiota bacterium]
MTTAATDAAAGEFGADLELRFTMTRTGSTFSVLTVPFVASLSATTEDDYTGLANNGTIPAGQAGVVLTLTVQPDQFSEGLETVLLTIGQCVGLVAGTPASARATIPARLAQGFYFSHIADPAKRTPSKSSFVLTMQMIVGSGQIPRSTAMAAVSVAWIPFGPAERGGAETRDSPQGYSGLDERPDVQEVAAGARGFPGAAVLPKRVKAGREIKEFLMSRNGIKLLRYRICSNIPNATTAEENPICIASHSNFPQMTLYLHSQKRRDIFIPSLRTLSYSKNQIRFN